jgi:hypothetical protein
MRPDLTRPLLVPAAIAAGLPVALTQISLLAAALSLLVSIPLICVVVVLAREARSSAARMARSAKLLGLNSGSTARTLVGSTDWSGGER